MGFKLLLPTTYDGNDIYQLVQGAYTQHPDNTDGQRQGMIFMVDDNIGNTADAVGVVGHEMVHHMDANRSPDAPNTQTYHDNRENYAGIMGAATVDYLDFNFASSGYTALGNANTHAGNRDATTGELNQTVRNNNAFFNSLDQSRVEYALYAFDGTGQDKDSPNKENDTNVARIYNLYDGNKFYVPGVGTNESDMGNFFGNVSGYGGDARIESMYENLVNTYNGVDSQGNPLPGGPDTDIDILGFSRGAALGRHFANYVDERGIPDLSSAKEITSHNNFMIPNGSYLIDSGIPNTSTARTTTVYENYLVPPGEGVTVRSMMLFDTVGSFGMPGDANEGNKNLSISPNVVSVTHAISARENRHDFPLTSIIDPSHPTDSRLNEQVFAGVHTDVGGGYKNNVISNDPLYWTANLATAAGVPLLPIPPSELPVGPNNVNRISHNEFYGELSWFYQPRQLITEGNNAPRNVFYLSNPVSVYDTNSASNQSSVNTPTQTTMPQHQQFMESVQTDSSQPLIYMNDGASVYDRNWQNNLLNTTIATDEEKDK